MRPRLLVIETLAAVVAKSPFEGLALYALAAVVLAVAVGVAIWLGRRVRRAAERDIAGAEPRAGPPGPSELTSRHVFRVLQERKIATVEQIAAMSPRERQLLFDAVARKVTPIVGVPTVAPPGATPAAPPPGEPAPADPPIGVVYCPACGGVLSAGADAPRMVTQCEGCGRRVAARRDGGRVSVTVDDGRDSGAAQSTPHPPQRPSGGSPTTRARS